MPQLVDSINCPNCGAPLELEPGEIILTCEFCASDINMATGAKYLFRHSVIPAKYTTPEDIFPFIRSWMSRGFLKPPDLADKSKIVSQRLEFIPFFVFNVKGKTDYHGYLTRTGTNEERKGTFEKEYLWKILARRGVAFPASEYSVPLDHKVPFSLDRIPPGAKFINAEVTEDDAKEMLRQQLDHHHRQLLSDAVDTFAKTDTSTEIKDMEFLHAPLWLLSYQYRDKVYGLVMDATTGQEVWGEIPQPGEKKGLFKKMFGRG